MDTLGSMNQTDVSSAVDAITSRIALVRGLRVILDVDLAMLYGVPTKRFNEAVKRNASRFPEDFVFALSADEFDALRSQFATSKVGRGGRRYAPRAFTEHGAIMAASILNSPRAVEVSIFVVRAFVRLRELAATHAELSKRLEDLERRTEALSLSHQALGRETRAQLKQVLDALRALMVPPEAARRPIGFLRDAES